MTFKTAQKPAVLKPVIHYAVVFSGRTWSGDPMAVMHSEHRRFDRALEAARVALSNTPYVWIEEWVDLPYPCTAATRTKIKRVSGRQPEAVIWSPQEQR